MSKKDFWWQGLFACMVLVPSFIGMAMLLTDISASVKIAIFVVLLANLCLFGLGTQLSLLDKLLEKYPPRTKKKPEWEKNPVLMQVSREDTRQKEMLSNISHEMKTPLTTISGYAEMLAYGMVAAEDVPSIAGKMLEESQRMLTMIERTMESARTVSAAPQDAGESFAMDTAAMECIARLEPMAQEKKINVQLIGEGIFLYCPRDAFDQIAYNLIENALKYTRSGGHVCVEIKKIQGKKTLIVRDNGIGIPEKYLDRIYERFFRGDQSHSRQVEGNGLGLSIVKNQVDLLGGDIAIESEVGTGTVVMVTFP